MYNKNISCLILGRINDALVNVQSKLLKIELDLVELSHRFCGHLTKKINLEVKHTACFQRFLQNIIQSYYSSYWSNTKFVLYLKTPLLNDGKQFLRLKIAFSRLLPFWQSILPNNYGREIILTFTNQEEVS